MNKELLIQNLNELYSSLPDLHANDDKERSLSKAEDTFHRYNGRLESMDLGEEYDVTLVHRKELAIDLLNEEGISVQQEVTDLMRQIEYLMSSEEISKAYDERIELLVKKREKYKNWNSETTYNNDYRAKYNSLSARIAKLTAEKNDVLESEKEKQNKLADFRRELQAKQERLTEINQKLKELRDEVVSIKQRGSNEETRLRLESDTEALYTMYRYFRSDPKTEVDKLIYGIEHDRLSEQQINERLQNINAMLSSRFYDPSSDRVIDLEEVSRRRVTAEQRRDELLEKTSSDDNYIIPNEKNAALLSDISLYEKAIQSLDDEKNIGTIIHNRRLERIAQNDALIAKYNDLIEVKNKRISTINNRRNITKEEKDRQIADVNIEISAFSSIRKQLEDETAELRTEKEIFERNDYMRGLARKRYVDRIEVCKNEISSSTLTDKEKDLREIEDLNVVIESSTLDEMLAKREWIPSLEKLIGLTGGEVRKEEKSGRALPGFTRNFTPEQIKIYEDILGEYPNEDVKHIEDTYETTFGEPDLSSDSPAQENDVKTNEKKSSAPSRQGNEVNFTSPEEEKPKKPISKPVKVRRFKLIPEKFAKNIKEFFEKHKKQLIALGISVAVFILACANSCNKNNKTSQVPTLPTNTPSATFVITPTEKPTPNVESTPLPTATPTPESVPTLTPKTKKEYKPTTDDGQKGWADPIPVVTSPVIDSLPIPNPGTTPTPEVTPEPEKTPDTPTPQEESSYILEKRPVDIPTGDSPYADPTIPYNNGESVYDETTNTWIDATGAKTTIDKETGEGRREPDAQPVIPVDETHNQIINPDTTPLEIESNKSDTIGKDSEGKEAISMEDALNSGNFTDDELDAYQDAFDAAFAEEDESLGR